MNQFVTSLLNVILLLTASLWLPFVYILNAILGSESSRAILMGEDFVLDRVEE